jgi:hypothetical protein
MARRLICRAALALFLGLGLAGLAAAQPTGYGPIPQPEIIQVPPAAPPKPPRTYPCLHMMESFCPRTAACVEQYLPLCCYAHHNMFGSGSLHSETTYIWGSSRAFFGQSCMTSPPPDFLAPIREANGEPTVQVPTRWVWCPSCR